MSNPHLHCPSCDHCISSHAMVQVERQEGVGTELLCRMCLVDEGGIPVCPAGESEFKPDTLRLMFIHNLREAVETVGL